jgi:release factor glutamine methyltransferase
MDLIVTPAVLIPRPETEHIIETVLELASQERSGGQECPPHSARLLDVGTGSGCVALALAKEFPQAEIHASDISAAALEVARANAARLQFDSSIQFHQADLFQGLDVADLDLIVSNPPYVGESEEDQVQLEVRKFEPRRAVFAGASGTEIIARLIPQAHAALRPGGWLIMEISGRIAGATKRLLSGWGDVCVSLDLQSIPRVARARKPR